SIAIVDTDGVVRGIATGKTTVNAITESGLMAEANVVVANKMVDSLLFRSKNEFNAVPADFNGDKLVQNLYDSTSITNNNSAKKNQSLTKNDFWGNSIIVYPNPNNGKVIKVWIPNLKTAVIE